MTETAANFINLAEAIKSLKSQVTSLTKERDELKEKVGELNQDVRFKCGQVAEHIEVKLKLVNENKSLKSQLSNRGKEIKELEEKLNNEWKDIKDAPRDGTRLLLVDINKNQRIGCYRNATKKWGTGWEGGDWEFTIDFDPQPIKWRPLTPPTPQEGGNE